MKKRILLIISIFVILFIISTGYNKYNKNLIVNEYYKINQANDLLSIMLEKKPNTGEYIKSEVGKWPAKNYTFNSDLSSCENGSKLIWDENNRKIRLAANKSDKCYVYFDKISDFVLNVFYNNDNKVPDSMNVYKELSCSSDSFIINNKYNSIEISSLNNWNSSCDIIYKDKNEKVYLKDKIKGMVSTTQGEGTVVNEKGYRYEGKNPNNYIWFNEELWRIVGVFDNSSHGKSGELLVKIVRNSSIGLYIFDKSNSNDWTKSNLKKVLNELYYNSIDGSDNENCYINKTVISTCNFQVKGIKESSRNMIEEVTWYLGGQSVKTNSETFYNIERGSDSVSGNISVTAKIGLLYASDYGFASLENSCLRTTILGSYGNGCSGENWISRGENEHLLSISTKNSEQLFSLSGSGALYGSTSGSTATDAIASTGRNVRPVLYLKSNVLFLDGDGSENNPYIIGI